MERKEEGKEERDRKYFPEQNSVALIIGSVKNRTERQKICAHQITYQYGQIFVIQYRMPEYRLHSISMQRTLILLLSSKVHTRCGQPIFGQSYNLLPKLPSHLTTNTHLTLKFYAEQFFPAKIGGIAQPVQVMCILAHNTPERSMKILNTPQ